MSVLQICATILGILQIVLFLSIHHSHKCHILELPILWPHVLSTCQLLLVEKYQFPAGWIGENVERFSQEFINTERYLCIVLMYRRVFESFRGFEACLYPRSMSLIPGIHLCRRLFVGGGGGGDWIQYVCIHDMYAYACVSVNKYTYMYM